VKLEGTTTAAGCRFAIVVARFNETVTEGLLKGALAALHGAEVAPDDTTVVRVPGAYELPFAAQKLAQTRAFDAVIALGCLIKGDTMHFEYIADAAAHGLMRVSLTSEVPVAFGLLTTLTDEQAEERSRDDAGNKGREAADAAIRMATLARQIDGSGA
jgi:6,7-dimethyl-8-ribityllumazine synthase